jgi:hypothetical protein
VGENSWALLGRKHQERGRHCIVFSNSTAQATNKSQLRIWLPYRTLCVIGLTEMSEEEEESNEVRNLVISAIMTTQLQNAAAGDMSLHIINKCMLR